MAKNTTTIIDTDIVIELYKGNEAIKKQCENIGEKNLYISDITVAEFYFGTLNKREMLYIKKHLNKFTRIPINEEISHLFVDMMKRYSLSHKPYMGDMLIAATAIFYDIHL